MTTSYDAAKQRYLDAIENLTPEQMSRVLRLLGKRPPDKDSVDYKAFGAFLKSPEGQEMVAAHRDFYRLEHTATLVEEGEMRWQT